ncbi:MAG: dual specificity protein phosphatase family protein [Nitrososphaerales archaeon]
MYSLGPDHHKISFIFHNCFLGPYEFPEQNEEFFRSFNFDAIINVMDYDYQPVGYEYYQFPLDDSREAQFFPNGAQAAEKLFQLLREDKKVYVNCAMGRSRSAAVILYCLCLYYDYRYKGAKDLLKYQRRCVRINERFLTQIRDHLKEIGHVGTRGFHDRP